MVDKKCLKPSTEDSTQLDNILTQSYVTKKKKHINKV